jgi:4-amino-4-deoxy-L-arabinose transferase-like glycosyltransferase
MNDRSGRRENATLLGLILLWLLVSSWMRPLALPDEGRYVGVALEMIRSGEWLTPTLNGLPFFHKPPLFYWITAGSLSLFGVNEWAARAAPILGAWLGAGALYFFSLRWCGRRAARLSLLALAVQPLFYIGAQFANLDMLVAGCIGATTLALAHVVLSRERGLDSRRMLLGAYAAAALGVLAKGLIGAVLPALIVLAWLVLLRRWRALWTLLSLPGLLLFFALTAPWFAVMQARFPEFLNYFFVVQHFKRFAAGGFNNVQPFWFYPAVLLLFSLPCLPWLYRQIGLNRPGNDPRGPVRLLMWLWLGVVVLFFSLPQSKLLGYILPAVPPLAFLMTDGFLHPGTPTRASWRAWGLSLLLSALVGIGVVLHFTLNARDSSRAVGAVLLAQRSALQPLFMLDGYYYDLPFYAPVDGVIAVINHWDDPALRLGDDGRKELLEAGQFTPLRAAQRLLTPAAFPAALCRAPVSWIVGNPQALERFPFVTQAQRIFSDQGASLWKVDLAAQGMASALGCDVGAPR